MVYNQAQTEMKKFLLLLMAFIPMVMIAQNTSPNVKPSAFVGTYSFTDADGSNGKITFNTPSQTDEYYYVGNGTCVFNGATHYFWWSKRNDEDNIELDFSKGDFPQFAIKGNPYKNDIVNITSGPVCYNVKNEWLYYDGTAMKADNPNLRFKLTKQ